MIKRTIYATAVILSGLFAVPAMAEDGQIIYLKCTVSESTYDVVGDYESYKVGYVYNFKVNLEQKTLFEFSRRWDDDVNSFNWITKCKETMAPNNKADYRTDCEPRA